MKRGEALSVGIVGCGARGLEHAEAVRDVAGLRLVGVADPGGVARDRVAACIAVPGFASAEDLVRNAAPEVVVLATPPAGRAALVARLLEAHTPRAILAEKPLALDLADGERILGACEKRAITLGVSHQSPYARSFLRLKRAIEELEIGALESLRAMRGEGTLP
jgi:predicted dehydrogenase